jgi:hypothetical protein
MQHFREYCLSSGGFGPHCPLHHGSACTRSRLSPSQLSDLKTLLMSFSVSIFSNASVPYSTHKRLITIDPFSCMNSQGSHRLATFVPSLSSWTACILLFSFVSGDRPLVVLSRHVIVQICLVPAPCFSFFRLRSRSSGFGLTGSGRNRVISKLKAAVLISWCLSGNSLLVRRCPRCPCRPGNYCYYTRGTLS